MAILPPEIVTHEILPRLPAKSLVRFKCVSKFFKTLISTPEFINLHLRHSLSSDANRLLFLTVDDCRSLYSFELDSQTICNIQHPFPLSTRRDLEVFDVVGICNGVLCIVMDGLYGRFECALMDLSTGISDEFYLDLEYIEGDHLRNLFYGFGFDFETNKYKFISVVYHNYDSELADEDYILSDDYDPDKIGDLRREVIVKDCSRNGDYSDSDSEMVESIICPEEHSMILTLHNGVLIGTHLLHWVFWSSSQKRHWIGCFDVCKEKWVKNTPMPDCYCGIDAAEHDVVDLGVVDGCLCLCLLVQNAERQQQQQQRRQECDGVIEVWMMKEYGVKESWVKLLDVANVDVIREVQKPFCRQNKGSKFLLLLWDYFMSQIGRNDIGSFAEKRGAPYHTQGCFYKGSLAIIAGMNQSCYRAIKLKRSVSSLVGI